jgi:O-antigen/teichoic acid export membrane protein
MTNYKRLLNNTILVSVGNLGSKLIALLMLPFYTRHLSVSDFGASDTVIVYVSLLLGIVTLSIAESLFIFPKGKSKKEQSEIFSSGITFSFIVICLSTTFLMAVNYLFLSLNILHSFTEYFWYICALLIAMVIQNITQQFTRGIDKLIVYSISGIVLTGLTAAFGFIIIPSRGLEGFFLSLILANLITSFYTLVHSNAFQYWNPKYIYFSKYKELIHYSTPLIPNALMWWIISSINRPLLEKEVGLEGIGILAVALKVPSVINVLFGIFMIAWQASVLEEFGKEGYRKYYRRVFLILSVVLGFIVILISTFRKEIIGLIADDKFIQSADFIPLLTVSAFFASLSGLIGANFSATKQSKYYFYSSVWGACSAMILSIWLIPILSLWGAVYAILLSQIIMFLSRQNYVYRILKSI